MKKLYLIVIVVGTLASNTACSHLQMDMSRNPKADPYGTTIVTMSNLPQPPAKAFGFHVSHVSLIQVYPKNLLELFDTPQVEMKDSVFIDMEPWMLFNIYF
jgi:hypothetical protein